MIKKIYRTEETTGGAYVEAGAVSSGRVDITFRDEDGERRGIRINLDTVDDLIEAIQAARQDTAGLPPSPASDHVEPIE